MASLAYEHDVESLLLAKLALTQLWLRQLKAQRELLWRCVAHQQQQRQGPSADGATCQRAGGGKRGVSRSQARGQGAPERAPQHGGCEQSAEHRCTHRSAARVHLRGCTLAAVPISPPRSLKLQARDKTEDRRVRRSAVRLPRAGWLVRAAEGGEKIGGRRLRSFAVDLLHA